MVEEREDLMMEEKSNSGSIDGTSSPMKKLLNSVKSKGQKLTSSSDFNRYPLRLRNPDLSNCHVCESKIVTKNGKDMLQTLVSQWRIVLICDSCYKNVQSAKICSYCFEELSELGISCRFCDHRIHQRCLSMFGRVNFCSDTSCFTCIDCWIPKSIKKVGCNRKRNGSSKIPSISSSSGMDSVSADVRNCSKTLEDKVNNAKSTAEMKTANAARAREKALEKAVVARQAAKMAANALDLAVVAATEESQVDGSSPVVDDALLALRLHRAINSSPRIFKNMRSIKTEPVVDPKKLKCDAYSLDRQSNLGSRNVRVDLDIVTNNTLVENPKKVVSEPSVQISSLVTLEPRERMESRGSQASCSSKVNISSGNGNNTDFGSRCCQRQEGLNRYATLNRKEIQCLAVHDKDSSNPKKKSSEGPDMYIRKYSRRGKGQNMYSIKYSRRRTKSQGIFYPSASFHPENFHLESQNSGTALPLTQMNITDVLTSNDSSFRSPFVPVEAYTPASSQS